MSTKSGPAQEPWEHWKTDKGYPIDRRLLQVVSVSEVSISIADLLLTAQKQTGVQITAFEPELQTQRVTVFTSGLPLNALMVQLARLIGLYWYQHPLVGGIEYVASYGSNPPSLMAKQQSAARNASFRQVRAARIADYIHALALSQEDLRELGKTDPALAGTMLPLSSNALRSRGIGNASS